MELVKNIVEYYDELFPVSQSQKSFYEKESESFNNPVKYLRISCGTGLFENYLAQNGADVTGIETITELIDSANRRKRTQLMSIRFFQMTSLEMTRFLGKGFYNIISCLDDRIELISDPVLIRKFFFDTKDLLSKNGKLIIKLINFSHFSKPTEQLPSISNIRVKLNTKIETKSDGSKVFTQEIETGNGRILPVMKDEPIYPLTKDEIISFGKEVGFKDIQFYKNFDREPFSDSDENIIAVLS